MSSNQTRVATTIDQAVEVLMDGGKLLGIHDISGPRCMVPYPVMVLKLPKRRRRREHLAVELREELASELLFKFPYAFDFGFRNPDGSHQELTREALHDIATSTTPSNPE